MFDGIGYYPVFLVEDFEAAGAEAKKQKVELLTN